MSDSEFFRRAMPWAIILVAHNWPVMLYTLTAAVSAFLAFKRPSRPLLLFLYGAIVLAVGYEYEKHAAPTFWGTASYLLGFELNPNGIAWTHWVFVDIAPVVIRVLGFSILASSILLHHWMVHRRVTTGRDALLEF